MTRARVLAGAATTLGAAVVFWSIFVTQMDRMPVAAMGAVMMAAMMLPSAVPLVAGQAQRPLAALAAVGIYLSTWTAIGAPALLLANMLPAAPIALSIVAVIAAAAYGAAPLQRACRERCRALCGSPLPALQLGLDYGAACIGCSAGVMAALFIAGPTNPLWMLIASAVAVAYKLPPRIEIVHRVPCVPNSSSYSGK